MLTYMIHLLCHDSAGIIKNLRAARKLDLKREAGFPSITGPQEKVPVRLRFDLWFSPGIDYTQIHVRDFAIFPSGSRSKDQNTGDGRFRAFSAQNSFQRGFLKRNF